MGIYLIKRVGQIVLVMFIVATLSFFLMNLLPGDPVYILTQSDDLSDEEYQIIYEELELDKPLPVRYVEWLGRILKGDFGYSYAYRMDVAKLISTRVPITLYLAALSLLISFPLGILFGIITAVKRGAAADTVITLIANTVSCLPQFWIGICLLYIFSMKLGWLPSFGFTWPTESLQKHIAQLIMPLFCLSIGSIGTVTRQTRSSMLEVIRQDYIRTARSKGLRERTVIFTHLLRNGLLSIITLIGQRLAFLIGGSMFVEAVFAIPGMGTLAVQAVNSRDVPTMQALVILTSAVCCVSYIITDLLYVLVDPRISLTESKEG